MNRLIISQQALPIAALVVSVTSVASPRAQENCRPIRFAPGHSAVTVQGIAPPDDAVCYSFAAGAGQTARLKVTGTNMIVSVIGIGDARDSWTFTTRAQAYKFVVGQLMRSVTPEPYTVTLSIR